MTDEKEMETNEEFETVVEEATEETVEEAVEKTAEAAEDSEVFEEDIDKTSVQEVVAEEKESEEITEEAIEDVSQEIESETDEASGRETEVEMEPETEMSQESEASTEDQSEPEEEWTEARMAELKGKIEAALFVTGKPLQIEELAEIVEADKELAEMATIELMQDYAFRQGTALEIDDTDGYILQVQEAHADVVNKMMPLELSAAVVRTLSAIAIKAPILQSDLIELRGSTAYDHIGDLLARKLISKRRKGRSFMLNTTEHFDQYFKLMGDKKELDYLVKQLGKEDKSSTGNQDEALLDEGDFDNALTGELDQEAV